MFKTSKIFPLLKEIFNQSETSAISMERDVLPHLTNQNQLSGCISSSPFAQIKSASSAVSVSAIYLEFAKNNNLAVGKNIIGDVFIHPTAKVDVEAKIGPNVTIGPNAIIKKGARIRNAIILDDTTIEGNIFHMLHNRSSVDFRACSDIGFYNRMGIKYWFMVTC